MILIPPLMNRILIIALKSLPASGDIPSLQLFIYLSSRRKNYSLEELKEFDTRLGLRHGNDNIYAAQPSDNVELGARWKIFQLDF